MRNRSPRCCCDCNRCADAELGGYTFFVTQHGQTGITGDGSSFEADTLELDVDPEAELFEGCGFTDRRGGLVCRWSYQEFRLKQPFTGEAVSCQWRFYPYVSTAGDVRLLITLDVSPSFPTAGPVYVSAQADFVLAEGAAKATCFEVEELAVPMTVCFGTATDDVPTSLDVAIIPP